MHAKKKNKTEHEGSLTEHEASLTDRIMDGQDLSISLYQTLLKTLQTLTHFIFQQC